MEDDYNKFDSDAQENVKVEFKNPRTDESVRVRGKIRNRTVYLYGVEFLSEEFEDRRRLARLRADVRSDSSFPSA